MTSYSPLLSRLGAQLPALGVVAVTAALVAMPWLRQELVVCEWLGIALALCLVNHIRGWRGETLALVAATLALGSAFHWSPKVLAYSMQTSFEIGLLFAIPIVLWDAARLAAPFWCAARLASDPRDAWLPAGLVAVVVEAVVPGVFPWKLGYSQIGWPVTIQGADLFGPEWPTFMLYAHAGGLVSLATVAALLCGPRSAVGPADAAAGPRPASSGPRFWTPLGLAAIGLAAVNAAYGVWAMQAQAAAVRAADTISVALVQVDPSDSDAIDDLRRLTREVCAGRVEKPFDLVCWPECSGGSYEDCLRSFTDPDRIFEHSRDPNRGLRPLESPSCPLLFGGKVYSGYPERPREIYQSAILLDRAEEMIGCYHKRHLMPFGEFVPGGDQFPQLRHYFPMEDEFAVGGDATVLACGDRARLGVLLCYEDMVPSAAATLVRNSANVLVSLINGSAFTEPLTLTQHRLLAQLRAVENRRCLLRCAATGETCVISPLGTVVQRLPLHTREVLAADVPLLEGRTLAGRIGPAFPLACAAGLAGLMVWGRRRPAFRPPETVA